MEKLLIVVDMQNDFITGSLGTPEARCIVKPMVEYIKNFDGDICFTYDTHAEDYLNTMEGKYLPIKHCIFGTEGWKINKSIFEEITKKSSWDIVKSTFGYKDWKFEPIKSYYNEIIIVGLCTDICVISNALILKATYPEIPIKVISNLCAGVAPEKHKAALEVMKSCQIEVI